jgi:ZIP family zinc transporter
MIIWLVVSTGFLFGGLLLFVGDKVFEYFNKENSYSNSKKRILFLILSITLHNIPEGLAIGVAFGSLKYNIPGSSLINAILLAVGIGIQNFPEGSAVSLPLRRDGNSRLKSFVYGSLTGIVEPISAILGVLLITSIRRILPLCLSFAAGAMIYVAVKELVPESQTNSNKNMITLWTLIGFIIMMYLDVTLG